MPTTTFRDDARAKQRRDERLKRRSANKIGAALNTFPVSIKREWTEELEGDAKAAFTRLLVGATHVCPACGHDNGPRTKYGTVYACGCERPNVNALRLYCELTGDVGTASQFTVNLNAQLGVRDEIELQQLVTSGRRMAQLSETPPMVMLQDAAEVIKLSVKQEPALRTEARRVLTGLLEALDGLSGAEEMNGDSH